MLDPHRGHRVAIAADLVAGLHLRDPQLVAQAAVDRAHRAEQVAQPGRAVNRQRPLAVAQVEGLEHAGQPEPVVGVKVGDEHVVELGKAGRAHELALGPLPAVEEQAIAAAAHEHGGHAAACGRDRPGRAGEEDVEVHDDREVRGCFATPRVRLGCVRGLK